jgi:hypothetical protein
MKTRLYIRVDDPSEIERPRWDGPGNGGELHVVFGDQVHLVLNSRAATELAEFLTAITLDKAG